MKHTVPNFTSATLKIIANFVHISINEYVSINCSSFFPLLVNVFGAVLFPLLGATHFSVCYRT